ncbi:MAG: type II toxin-antitoxin system HicB family antitoxin [Nitrospiraceae bacterium]|nr:type II toxin-antitoxin system HicB family antitoxin [Nitrospiraceae bacterium]
MREFIVYQDNDGQWGAECQEMPGYRARAGSKEEAVEKMKAALLVFFCRVNVKTDRGKYRRQ